MPVPMPRLIRDTKSGFYFFRLVLPRSVPGEKQKSMYFSLKTRENKAARAKAAILNLRVEMTKPYIDIENIRELINIDLKNGIFQADTAEEQERGLKILQAMGQAQAVKQPLPAVAAAPVNNIKVTLYDEAVRDYLTEITPTLKATTVYKYKNFLNFLGIIFPMWTSTRIQKKTSKPLRIRCWQKRRCPNIRYTSVIGTALTTLLASNPGKTACWNFQFTGSAGTSTQPTMSYCK